MPDEDIQQMLDRQSLERRARVMRVLKEGGHTKAAADFAAELRDIDLGITGARGTWHALSGPQRRVLRLMGEGRALGRSGNRYNAEGTGRGGNDGVISVCGLPTARNLSARDLIACDGGAFDPEANFVITERGLFVLKHGPSTTQQGKDV